ESTNYLFRKLKNQLIFGLCLACIGLALVPLGSILFEVAIRGLPAINVDFFTKTPGIIGQPGGGIAEAIQGTLILVALTCLIGVPIGIFAGIYLAEFGDNQYGRFIRFLNDVLTEFPSIVVGILAYSLIVLATRSYSAWAGAVALSFIMMPIVARTTEESLKIVPTTVRDAAAALGIRRWRSTFSIVLTTGKNGVVTGVLLSVARIAGETAPLILTVLGSSLFFNLNDPLGGLKRPIDALPLRIYRYALLPYPDAIQQGWGAALVLIMMVLSINILVRVATRGKGYGGKRL
ncbi:MAG TPA: phosphate ABC transporter permease PstA, partial [Candidatus Binatus sp.]|nr:phosphate ABC transporter permease PstA [Candidatus Binatus sp.]